MLVGKMEILMAVAVVETKLMVFVEHTGLLVLLAEL